MQVTGPIAGLWLPQWEGFAFDSIDAGSRARRWFYGALHGELDVRSEYPLRILSAVPVAI